ncbi:trehalase-like isoform X2 [Portunus trituberculatus]|uniref:trehalase-like isoform X2 n=1 Tax=Portunus trituberculatus TaxID=210409 RepID=UPI001E1CD760|nr:trehalase-like isoform X2 [Portunus trituberculatus]
MTRTFSVVMEERRRRGAAAEWQRNSGVRGGLGRMVPMALVFLAVAVVAPQVTANDYPPPCDSKIYCHGELLKTVQMAKLHNDSKYFVDMSLKLSERDTLLDFEELMNRTQRNPTKEEIQTFVDEHFHKPGDEFEDWDPSDWSEDPEFLKKIVHPELKEWGKKLNAMWKQLGRKISTTVKDNPEKHSQIYVPNPVIVPGGRFREFYYWDSYWTIEGLLLSGMNHTVKGMLENFLMMVKTYGMVPNGGRIYYTRRSQPPYLIPMFKLYMDHHFDQDFLRENIEVLEKEFLFWHNERQIEIQDRNGRPHLVAQYRVNVSDPRPESYREDYMLAQDLATEEEKQRLYVELKSGAESGWDYSTRWFVNNETNNGTMKDTNVTSIVPVDLNSLLCVNARTLSYFYNRLGMHTKEREYARIAKEKNDTMSKIFWDQIDGVWYDYDLNAKSRRRYFYMSNLHPIWSGCYGPERSRARTMEKLIKYLENKGVFKYVGGMPTSLEDSGQQWDFPNAWAPLQHLAIMGLYEARNIHHAAEELSFELAKKWIRTNWKGYQELEAMFEKYNVTVVGKAGGGGEYEVQPGFGWSNGVAMRLLELFGDRLTPTEGNSAASPTLSLTLGLLMGLLSLGVRSHFF